jgi:hypothetical protein
MVVFLLSSPRRTPALDRLARTNARRRRGIVVYQCPYEDRIL